MNYSYYPLVINPYFHKNIFYNFNINDSEKLYTTHIEPAQFENYYIKKQLEKMSPPDVIVSTGCFDGVDLPQNIDIIKDYILIKSFYGKQIFKDAKSFYVFTYASIFVRKELYNKLKL